MMLDFHVMEVISSSLATLKEAWKCNPRAQFRVLAGPLRMLALDIHGDIKGINWFGGVSMLIMMSCYYWVFMISLLPYITRTGALREDERIATIVVMSLGLSSEIGLVKLFCLFIHRKRVKLIVAGSISASQVCHTDAASKKELRIRLTAVWRRVTSFWCVIIMNGICYIVEPLFRSGHQIMVKQLPILGLDPMFESPKYEIAYIMESIGTMFTVITAASASAFLVVVAGHAEAQLHVLALRLRQFSVLQTPRQVPNDVDETLKNIIQSHDKTLTNVRQLETVFRIGVALEFILLAAGLIAELLGGLKNTYMEVPFALVLVSMDCLSGQRLMDAALEYERAVYACGWETWNQCSQRTALYMLLAAQRRVELSAGGVATLSFECLMAVLKSVYSAYATLRTVVH